MSIVGSYPPLWSGKGFMRSQQATNLSIMTPRFSVRILNCTVHSTGKVPEKMYSSFSIPTEMTGNSCSICQSYTCPGPFLRALTRKTKRLGTFNTDRNKFPSRFSSRNFFQDFFIPEFFCHPGISILFHPDRNKWNTILQSYFELTQNHRRRSA